MDYTDWLFNMYLALHIWINPSWSWHIILLHITGFSLLIKNKIFWVYLCLCSWVRWVCTFLSLHCLYLRFWYGVTVASQRDLASSLLFSLKDCPELVFICLCLYMFVKSLQWNHVGLDLFFTSSVSFLAVGMWRVFSLGWFVDPFSCLLFEVF